MSGQEELSATELQNLFAQPAVREFFAKKYAEDRSGSDGGGVGSGSATQGREHLTHADLESAVQKAIGMRSEAASRDVPRVFAAQGVTSEQFASVQTYLKSVKLAPSEKWAEDDDRDVLFFLNELSGYYEITLLPESVWALFARNYLAAKPRKLWDREVEHLHRMSGSKMLAWKDFETFMRRAYASVIPAREARHQYKQLQQTGSVKEFVREQTQLVRELESTPYHPGGSVFDDFIDGLKPEVQRFVQDNAPAGWWTSIKDLYQKALDFEMNSVACYKHRDLRHNENKADKSDVQGESDSGSDSASGTDSDSHSQEHEEPLLEPNHSGGKRPRVADDVYQARKGTQRCFRCGEAGHVAKACNAQKRRLS